MTGNLFTTTEFRLERMVWLIGLLLGIPGTLIATFVFHNETESWILFGLSIVCYMPLLITLQVQIHKTRQEIKHLQLKMDIIDWITKILDEPKDK